MKLNRLGRRISAALGAALLALGVGASAAAASANAATKAPEKQTITLIKYKSGDDLTEHDPTIGPDPSDAKERVNGAIYTVYDVTDQYWQAIGEPGITKDNIGEVNGPTDANPYTAKHFDVSKAQAVKVIGTSNGQATTELPTQSNGHSAVYLFRESHTPTGFQQSYDFLLGLPARNAAGEYPSQLYVYPKDAVKDTYYLQFRKVDQYNPETPLAKAVFYVTRKNGDDLRYARIEGQKAVTGFSVTPEDVTWVTSTDDATKFTSDSDGRFGFGAFPETVTDNTIKGLSKRGHYGLQEITAPAGYTDKFTIAGGVVKVGQVASGDDKNDVTNQVSDMPESILPHTGGKGIIALIAVGTAMVAVGAIVYVKRRVVD
ncbi:pilin N-terminal domain-containing protein [Lacticaseibacillus hulanensis]|uniref:pilin N-terminal domain-containing protein n=1 Tax=Lacticaseibacillus hulanensis TaxID=2493111 RepID=UPI000FDCB7D4|nr:pilin N-terminal domain-containing protein [Lacticaseibacillus hulanensis]